MKATLLGTAPPLGTLRTGNAGTGILVELDGSRMLVDCGPGVTNRLHRIGVDIRSVDTLLLTHHHWDHIADLTHFVLGRWEASMFGSARDAPFAAPLTIYGPVGTRRVGELLFGPEGVYAGDIATRFAEDIGVALYRTRGVRTPFPGAIPELRHVTPGDEWKCGGFALSTAEADHCAPHLVSLAYRISAATGVLVFSGDSAPSEAVTQLALGADVLVHDSGMTEETRAALGREGIHSTSAEVGHVAASAGVRRLVVVHHGLPAEDHRGRAKLKRSIRAVFEGDVLIASDLDAVVIGGPST